MKTSSSYDAVAKTLHWLIALAIIGMLLLGWLMGRAEGADKFALFQWHKSIGITIMLLAVFRLFWRWMHRPPELPPTMPGWEKFAAHAGHFVLYVLMIGMPFAGWVMVSASPMNLPTVLYGLVPWPHLPVIPELPNKKDIGHLANRAHYWMAWIILLAVIGHAAAAWKHHLFNRDDVLTRMAPKFMQGLLNRIRGQK